LDACSVALEGLGHFKAGTVPVSGEVKKLCGINDDRSWPMFLRMRCAVQTLVNGAIMRTIFVQSTRMARK
jgi:hypothetical protein